MTLTRHEDSDTYSIDDGGDIIFTGSRPECMYTMVRRINEKIAELQRERDTRIADACAWENCGFIEWEHRYCQFHGSLKAQ